MPVGKTNKAEIAKRRRRLKLDHKKALELLPKKAELHPVAASIVDAVASKEIEAVHIYAAPEPPPTPKPRIPVENIHVTTPRPKTWVDSFWEFWS